MAGPVRRNRPGRESRVDDRAAEGDLQLAVGGERPAQRAAVGGAAGAVRAGPELVGAVGGADGLVVGAGDREPAGRVVGESGGAFVEGEVAFGVVDADVVGDGHRAGVAVVGEAVVAVVVGDV